MPELFEVLSSLLEGQNESLAPTLVSDIGYRKGINVSVRNGLIQTRPRWKKMILQDLIPGEHKGTAFINRVGESKILVVAGMNVYLVDLEDGNSVYTFTESFDTDFNKAYICTAENLIIAQNGEDRPIILQRTITEDRDGEETIDEKELRTSESSNQLPIGTYMIYLHGRIFVCTDEKEFKASDIFVDTNPDSLFTFNETNYLNGGGSFGMPASLGAITGFARTVNAGKQGYGALQVHTNEGVAAYHINAARYLWGEMDLSEILYDGPGSVSDRSFATSNNDLLFRSNDSIRSFGYTASEKRSGNGFMVRDASREVQPSLDEDTDESMPYVSMAKANDRIHCTVHPDPEKPSVFRGMTSLDLAPTSTINKGSAPAYDGIWTGLRLSQIITATIKGRKELVAVVQGEEGIEFYTLDNEILKDNETTLPKCRLYTKAYNFNTMDVKEFQRIEISLSGIQTDAEITVYCRPSGYPLWSQLATHTIKVPDGSLAQPRRLLRFSADPEQAEFNPVTDASLHSGQDFEFCIEWSGVLQIEKARMVALSGNEEFSIAGETEEEKIIQADSGVSLDDLDYEVK